ncbi:peptide chain release factor family protein [Desulfoluna spongiiphila]|uniref:peptide chain release factor family protein n=1 Tax=Desulfoluna spongiiphila TaxID=419481 RepID=UPI001256278E|nr:peptide chain release factor-like protein [Desulfoluna spongiiphila]VVS94633.1 peptide chain release factor class i/class ii [Desulfoluna spongiiphila]
MGPGDKKVKELKDKMGALGIKPGDIDETFIRSSGRGGQRLNKVASCVHLRHRPTGIIVKYGAKRSQNLNRFLGLRLLVEKIDETLHGTSRTDTATEKLRRQKQRRKRRSRSKYTS